MENPSDILYLATALFLDWELTELCELLERCFLVDNLEGLHLALVMREDALVVANATNTWEDASTLYTLGKAAED